MLVGIAKIDITPTEPVWMDGMIRVHRSEGVHDRLYARALVLSNSDDLSGAFAVVSVDICGLSEEDGAVARAGANSATGIPAEQIIIACTHTHSGPATVGYFNPKETAYTKELIEKLVTVIADAAGALRPAAVGCASGEETTISHYRRLLADDGHVVMNWEPYPAEHIVAPLGVIDPEVGVLKVTAADDPAETLCVLFNHAGHPNVLSGENYLISADYPGRAMELLDAHFGGMSLFVNGAQGTMDIDGLRDRDWEGRERIGNALANAVMETAGRVVPSPTVEIHGQRITYTIPRRRITDEEWAWAEGILRETGGTVTPLPDGVGDDYLAVLFKRIREAEGTDIPVEQIGFTLGDTAYISFPGELYTEIGMRIKAESPFAHTYIIGLANGKVGYIPTRKAIAEGGYAEDTREVDAAAEEVVFEQSIALLTRLYTITKGVSE